MNTFPSSTTLSNHFLIKGDCAEKMRDLAPNSVDAIVTDPPYALTGTSGKGGFMGAKWDSELPTMEMWKEALRVAKPGANLLAFGGTRTYHRLACAIEDAGWEVRDCIMWVYGCLSEDSQILTPSGYASIGEINVGDRVVAFDTATEDFHTELCQRTYLYDYDDTAYAIKSDKTDQIVSKNHRVLIRDGKFRFEFAENIKSDTINVPIPRMGVVESTAATITPVHYKGRMWCVSVPSGAIVARRNGKIFVTGNSGFPKSMDVSKAIDKMLGAEREKIQGVFGKTSFGLINDDSWQSHKDIDSNVPATPEAAAWQGFGTALKPAVEPIVVARKPIEGTVAANVLKYGTGAINIDGCRIPLAADDKLQDGVRHSGNALDTQNMGWGFKNVDRAPGLGRFPANLIHDGSDEVLALFPDSKGQCGAIKGNEPSELTRGIYGKFSGDRIPCPPRNDSGSAARFFYCAKASRAERNKNCERLLQWEQNQELTQLIEKSNQLLTGISESGMRQLKDAVCNMTSYGRCITDQSQEECKSTISTATRLITELKTSLSSQQSNTSDVILDAIKTSEESGINVAQLAEKLKHLKIVSTSVETDIVMNAVNALFAVLSEIRSRAKQRNHHCTVKPVALMRYLVRLVTRKGGIVLDPFMGSGTTGVAAIQEGMNFIGIERDPHYYEIASRRVNDAKHLPPTTTQQELPL